MIYIIEALSFFYALFMAVQNEVPVTKMINAGASAAEEKQFHVANALLSFMFLFTVTIALQEVWWQSILSFLLLGFVYYLTFDIALNKLLGKRWDYIGNTARLDRLIKGWFGEHAGRTKALICLIVIIVLNVLKTIVW